MRSVVSLTFQMQLWCISNVDLLIQQYHEWLLCIKLESLYKESCIIAVPEVSNHVTSCSYLVSRALSGKQWFFQLSWIPSQLSMVILWKTVWIVSAKELELQSTTMTGCCAFGSSNRSENGYSMHHFPSDPERRKMWANRVNRSGWKPTNSSFLCQVSSKSQNIFTLAAMFINFNEAN